MALGDKTYNRSYYGYGSRIWTKDDIDVATLPEYNLFRSYYAGSPPAQIPERWGKPFDASIALWYVPYNSSYATNACYCRAKGNNSLFEFSYNIESKAVPLLFYAKNNDNNSNDIDLSADLTYRYAYDLTKFIGVGYSSLISDIRYNGFCLYPRISVYKFNTEDTPLVTIDITTLEAYINNDPDNRFVSIIRPSLYYGSSDIRSTDQAFIPTEPGESMAYRCVPLVDAYADRPVPTLSSIRDYVQCDAYNTQHTDWISDKVFSPFQYQYRNVMFFSTATYVNDLSQFFTIGINRSRTKNQWIAGAYTVPNSSDKVTGEYYRLNTNTQYFDDVVYKWETIIYDSTARIMIDPDADLSQISSNDNIRVLSRLIVLDTKGDTIGAATVKAVKHEMSYIGMYWAETADLAANGVLGSSGDGVGIYLPKFNGNVTTGEYYTGEEIKTAPNADLSSVSGYKASETEGDKGEFISAVHNGKVEGGAQYFVLTQSQADDIITYLNTTYSPADMEELTTDFKGSNPFDYITCFKYYPFDIPVLSGAGAEFCIGPLDLGYKRRTLEHGYGLPGINYLDMGSYYITPHYGDYRDYKETMLTLMLPWCGIMQLDPVLYMGHTLSVKYAIDFVTGTVTAYIYRDALIMDSANGKIGVDIPLSAVANGSYQVAITNAIYQIKEAETARMWAGLGVAGGLIGTAVSAVSGNLLGAAAGIAGTISAATKLGQISDKIDNLEYNMDHTQPRVGQISSASPLNACTEDRRVQLLIIRHKMLEGFDATAYGKSTGYACSMSGLLGEFKGFTKCSSIDLSGLNCTDAEKTMINNLVKQGVRL